MRDPAQKDAAGKCPSCLAAFGESLQDQCEEALSRGLRVIRITCGGCTAKLLVSIDQVGRLGVSLDKTGGAGEHPVLMPIPTNPRERGMEA